MLTRGDITAVVAFEATMAVPGRVIPNDSRVEQQVLTGERRFQEIGCATCHIPSLPLDRRGWIYAEPAPFDSSGARRRNHLRFVEIDLTNQSLPLPRLLRSAEQPRIVWVPAYTDYKLHDISPPSDDSWTEPLDLNQPPGTPPYFKGNRRFLTKRLWGAANEPPYFHHGLLTTLREAVMAHDGEASQARQAFQRLSLQAQDTVLAFLTTLQVLPPGTSATIVDEHFKPKAWPPKLLE